MDIKRLAPWNWFEEEQSDRREVAPSVRSSNSLNDPFTQMHRELDRVFENLFSDRFGTFGNLVPRSSESLPSGSRQGFGAIRPSIDIAADEKEYVASIELPGVQEKDVQLEVIDNQLVIRGEKRQEEEKSERDYYRIERSYGSFQRTLSLPEDVDQSGISAEFRNGVISVHLPRRAIEQKQGKKIELKKAA